MLGLLAKLNLTMMVLSTVGLSPPPIDVETRIQPMIDRYLVDSTDGVARLRDLLFM